MYGRLTVRRVAVVVTLLGVSLAAVSGATALAQGIAETSAIASARELSIAFRQVARETLPSVVSVVTSTRHESPSRPRRSPSLEDELFRRFFGDLEGFGVEPQTPFRQRSNPRSIGQGSGFVIDPEGVIVTNSHVVSGADEVLVQFEDGTQLPGESWFTDPWSDLAIIRVQPPQPLAALRLADSDQVEVGDWVLAVGDPFGVGTSITAGIISGKGRAPGISHREEFLQTDAAINPGNSGGPLVNLNGEVVGVNTAISTRSGGYDGVGFAIPSNLVSRVAEQLVAHGKVKRPYLGVAVQRMTQKLREQFGIGAGEGALVAQTYPDSPAAEAGLRPGDIILEVAGRKVTNGVSLQGIVEQLTIGERYTVRGLRDGEPTDIQVTLREMPDRFAGSTAVGQSGAPRDGSPESAAAAALGLEVADLTDKSREALGIDKNVAGVVVTAVDPNGPAAEEGIGRGDVIVRVGTTRVSSVAEFEAALGKFQTGDGVLLLVQGARGSRFVVVQPVR